MNQKHSKTNPNHHRRNLPMSRTLILAVIIGALGVMAPGAAAAPPLLWQVPVAGPASGPGAGELTNPRGVAVDPDTGHVFVAEGSNSRISEFTAWGEFVKAFGWNVNAAAPAEELQVCTAETGCQKGSVGAGRGQFSFPTGLAIGAGGEIYAVDNEAHRVQAFAPDGTFLFMVGAEVNRTKVEAGAPETEQNLCPVDPGDVCQAGVSGTGPGEFSNQSVGDLIGTDSDGTIYVGDVGRIEKFDADGSFSGEVTAPALSGRPVGALDIDGAGNSYVTFGSSESEASPAVLKLGPSGEELATFDAPEPVRPDWLGKLKAVAVGASGNVYAVNDPNSFGNVGLDPRIVEFDPAGEQLIPSEDEAELEKELGETPIPLEPFLFGQVRIGAEAAFINGLASSSACGIPGEDLFVSYFKFPESLLRAYGPNPDPSICPPPAFPPTVVDTFATAVDADSATVKAKINSHFWGDATYYVEYGTGKCSEGGCTEAQPTPPGSQLGSESGVAVPTAGVLLPGLEAATTYHYRFVAASSGGGPVQGVEATFTTPPATLPVRSSCPNQAFRTGLSAFLPACRAFEMVSPIDKAGADITVANEATDEVPARLNQSSSSGDRITYSSSRAFGNAISAPYTSQYLASRDPGSGWSSASISAPRTHGITSVVFTSDTDYQAFSEDLCQGWLRLPFEVEPDLDPAEVDGYGNLFKRQNCSGEAPTYEALTTVAPPNDPEPRTYFPHVEGVSADGRCTVFSATDALTPEAPVLGGGDRILYETCDGVVRLVAILPNGTPAGTSSAAGASSYDASNLLLRVKTNYHAVSEDGTRVYWNTQDSGPGQIYLRINADQPQSFVSKGGKCTEPESACSLPVSEKVSGVPANFQAAAADGSRALFGIPVAGLPGENLYEFEATDLSETKATLVAEGFLGLLGASDDATRFYFASVKALGPDAVEGKPNLYYFQPGSPPRFIATLAAADLDPRFESVAITPQPGHRAARVTPDGRHAAFMSAAPLTGYDNVDQRNDQRDREVFLYDATANGGEGELVCASCDPSGARPIGANIARRAPVWAAGRIPTWPSSLYPSNALSADGDRLFFDSFGPLVQRDTNGKADVYEWQNASSAQECEEEGAERYVASSSGCLSLISSGRSDQDSEFVDADPRGDNAFFATGDSLLPQDPGLIDIYVARRGGGFPPPPTPPAICEGEACQSPPAPPNDPSPASATYQGKGNVDESTPKKKRCPKGKVRRKGRCVKKHHKSSKHHKRSPRAADHDRRNHR
jgi:hypothetical protein